MELRVLRYFLAVAREETISGAAESLHVTQPTLSRQLMELEEQLGKKLFIRGSRRVTLTDEGAFLRKRAQEIIDLADRTEADFKTSDAIVGGDVYIGGGETEAMRLIARVIRKMRERYPNIRVHLFSGNAEAVTERLDRGLLDFGVLIEPGDITKYGYMRLPAADTWGVLMRRDSPLAVLPAIEAEALRGLPLLCSRQALGQNELSGWFGSAADKVNVVMTYNLIYNAALMVEEGIGYALCLDRLVNTTGDSALCFRPLKPRLEAHLDIVWKKHPAFSRASEIFLKQLQALLTEDDGE